MRRDQETYDELIVKALTERKRKTDLILGWENRSGMRARLIPAVTFMAAACIAAVFLLLPGGGTCMDAWNAVGNAGTAEVMRAAGGSGIDSLISEGGYEDALALLDSAITAAEVTDSIGTSDEESAYEAAMAEMEMKALLWKRIYVLTCMDRRNDVISALENFIGTYGESGYPAEEYLMELKKVQE